MPTLTRPVNIKPADQSALQLWIAELSYEMSLARKLLKLVQEFEQTARAGSIGIAATAPTNTPSANTDAR